MDSRCRSGVRRPSPAWRGAILLVSLFATFLVGCASTSRSSPALPSTGNEALDYYPLLSGWGWAFEIERDGNKVLAPYAVVERAADLAVVKNGDERITYAIRPDGIARRDGDAVGDFMLRVPVRKGTTWPVQGGDATIVEVGARVALPSGTYSDCAVVEEVRRDPSRVTRTTYCRGVGPVDIEMRVFDPFKKSFETMAHARLLSITRPEVEP
jgi:hypothetical protein